MRSALLTIFAALPKPKFVIAVGACAISGGPFVDILRVAQNDALQGIWL